MSLCYLLKIYLPISLDTSINFDFVLEISTILMPRLANCLAYSRPMPSVEPVITVIYGHCSMFQAAEGKKRSNSSNNTCNNRKNKAI